MNFSNLISAQQGLEKSFGLTHPRPELWMQFFAYSEKSSKKKVPDHRRDFWMPLFEAQLIDGYCVAAAQKAAEAFAGHPISRLKPHKHLQKQQAALIMKIGKLIVVEWSPMGKCRLWYAHNSYAPLLYKPLYTLQELSLYADHTQQHHRTSQSSWQEQLNAWLDRGF